MREPNPSITSIVTQGATATDHRTVLRTRAAVEAIVMGGSLRPAEAKRRRGRRWAVR